MRLRFHGEDQRAGSQIQTHILKNDTEVFDLLICIIEVSPAEIGTEATKASIQKNFKASEDNCRVCQTRC